jgi:hypothetical protein
VQVARRVAGGSGDAVDLVRAVRGEGGRPGSFARLPRSERSAALVALGRWLRRMHDANVSHRDLKAPNLMAWSEAAGAARSARFAVVDLEGAALRRTSVPWARRARDVARLDASFSSREVSRSDRVRVLSGYFAGWAGSPWTAGRFAAAVARASARKRAPSGNPR